MKVISLLQPWASLVVLGYKKIETRSWNTKYRGELLIHASKRFSDDLKELTTTSPFKEVLMEAGLLKVKGRGIYTNCQFALPTSGILGKVNLMETRATSKNIANYVVDDWVNKLPPNEFAFGDFSPNRYGWLLSDAVAFENPIPFKGKLGIWDLPFTTIEMLQHVSKNLDDKQAKTMSS